jgi:hypothetical protein
MKRRAFIGLLGGAISGGSGYICVYRKPHPV